MSAITRCCLATLLGALALLCAPTGALRAQDVGPPAVSQARPMIRRVGARGNWEQGVPVVMRPGGRLTFEQECALAVELSHDGGTSWIRQTAFPGPVRHRTVVVVPAGPTGDALVRLVDGIDGSVSRAKRVRIASPAIAVTVGERFSAALHVDGLIRLTGVWPSGLLVAGTAGSEKAIVLPGLDSVVAVSAGRSHLAAVRSDGSAWIWGSVSGYNRRPDPLGPFGPVPTQIDGLANIEAVWSGSGRSFFRDVDGRVYGFTGDHAGPILCFSLHPAVVAVPRHVPVEVPELRGAAEIAMTGVSGLARFEGGRVVVWGEPHLFRGAPHVNAANLEEITPLPYMPPVISIDACESAAAVLLEDGRVMRWGGYLARRQRPDFQSISQFPFTYFLGSDLGRVFVSDSTTLFGLNRNAQVTVRGYSRPGQDALGVGNRRVAFEFVGQPNVPNARVFQSRYGETHLITYEGEHFRWGARHRLGEEEPRYDTRPVRVYAE